MNIPKGYPNQLSEEEILMFIKTAAENIRGSGSLNDILWFTSLINLGQNELQYRNNQKSGETIEKSARSSNKLSKLAIIISSTAVITTAIFGSADYFSDKRWQKQQINKLEEIGQIAEKVGNIIILRYEDGKKIK